MKKALGTIVKYFKKTPSSAGVVIVKSNLSELERKRAIASRLNQIYMEEIDDIKRFVILSSSERMEH